MLTVALPVIVVLGNLPSSLISALIIGFALHQAWTMNRRLQIVFTGPYTVTSGPLTRS
jgi:hypothetical protein